MRVCAHTQEKSRKDPEIVKIGKFSFLYLDGWLLECHLTMHHFHTVSLSSTS